MAFAGDVARGEIQFRKCLPCHSIDQEGKHRVGPRLYNLFQTRAATAPDYNFSEAAKSRQVLWTDENIHAHTEDPRKFTPGTKMIFAGIKNKSDRDDLIAYMKKASSGPATRELGDSELRDGVFFYQHIRPVIKNYCDGCHGNKTNIPADELRGMLLQTYNDVVRANVGGRFVIPGDPKQSRLVQFLDGARHFVTVQDHEKRLVERWIREGARLDGGIVDERHLIIDGVARIRAQHVYCYVAWPSFVRLDVTDRSTGQVYFTEWSSIGGGWVDWQLPERSRNWPSEVDVQLTISSGVPGTKANTPTANNLAIFIVSPTTLSDPVRKMYSEQVAFRNNPIKSQSDKKGTFEYLVHAPSDVKIQVSRSSLKAPNVFSYESRNLPIGKNTLDWNFSDRIEAGDYSVRFRFTSRGPLIQPEYVLLLSAE